MDNDGVVLLPEVRKGKADWREYRPFRLANGVTCMAVHDKESKKTAMATAIHAGAAADPRSLSGLAHFCEHMCFLGSERYPGENEYKSYLASHGGRSNASTSLHLTTYKFDVLAEHAEHAIDIFSNFFVAPLFTSSGTSREVNAVNSENSKNLTDDSRRQLQILKALADPEHYYSKFTTGNSITLPAAEESDNREWVRDALLAFHRHHYCPENMTIVVVGPQSLDILQDWIVPRYGAIRAHERPRVPTEIERLIIDAAVDMPNYAFGLPIPDYNPAFNPKFQSGRWPVLLTMKPLRSMRKLALNFPLPSTQKCVDQSPERILSHLLGHEGPGSSFATLQSTGLIRSLSAGSRIYGPDQTLFQLSVGLTEHGEDCWEEVVSVLLAHCQLILTAAINAKSESTTRDDLQRIWGEQVVLSKTQFDQTSPGEAYDLAPSLAQAIVRFGTESCRSAGSMLNEIPESCPIDALVDFAARLKPQNCIVERCSQSAWDQMEASVEIPADQGFGKQQEKWYGIDYYLVPIEAKTVRKWENVDTPHADALHLPKPNRYIPRSLELCPELPDAAKAGPRIEKDIEPPQLLIVDPIVGRLWHRLDDRYALPKASLTLLLRNAAVSHSNVDGVWTFDTTKNIQSTMLSSMFSQAMAQETYDAHLAGLNWSLSTSTSGVTISCSGYSDRLLDLALKLLTDFFKQGDDSLSFFRDFYFNSTKDNFVRSLSTYFQSRRADSHAMYYRDLLMSNSTSAIDDSLSAAKAASLRSLQAHHTAILEHTENTIECLCTGNVSSVEATTFFKKASKIVIAAKNGEERTSQRRGRLWVPGPDKRRLEPAQQIQLHFASQNPEDENGAVFMTYQSQIPAWRGEVLSTPQSLKSSASLRLLCHMLREPLFNNLRTKQQLGYVVSSYYDLGHASTPDQEFLDGTTTTPIDYIAVNVLSHKVSPPEIVKRIDEFMTGFRLRLETIPESEIRDHADALSAKILAPIQKLGTEASIHFGKILRNCPEILQGGRVVSDIPWNSSISLASTIKRLERGELIETWDRVVLGKPSRIVSCVYGKKFPLQSSLNKSEVRTSISDTVVDNTKDILKFRKRLQAYGNSSKSADAPMLSRFLSGLSFHRTSGIGLAAVAVIGAGLVGAMAWTRKQKK